MAKHVTVKEVEGEYIWLEEVNRSKPNLLKYLKIIGIIFGLSSIFFYGVGIASNTQWDIYWIGIPLVFTLLMTGVVALPAGLGNDLIPSYSVDLSNSYGANIIITKTTPDEDQVAICKAVQELEQKAHEMAKKKRELEQIGLKCK